MKTLAVVLAGFCLAGFSAAQTVKQGDPTAPPLDPNEFHSPMVIETIFAPADPTLWKNDEWRPDKPRPWKSGQFTTAEYYDLGKYSCDGLSIRNGSHRNGSWDSGLMMSVKDKGGMVHVGIEVHVTNPGHVHDKFVTFLLEVVNGDTLVAKTTIKFKAKQNWRRNEELSDEEGEIVLSADSLKKNPLTKLRITMTAQDY